jgi:hypothetical protein
MSLRVRFHQIGELGKDGTISFWRRWPLWKWAGTFLMLMAALLVISCSKEASPSDPASAAQQAVRLYPALGVKDSTFNKAYIKLYREAAQRDSSFLKRPEWPLELAHRTAALLGMQSANALATPLPVAAMPVTPPPPTPAWNPLENGSWKEGTKVVKGTPWIHRY